MLFIFLFSANASWGLAFQMISVGFHPDPLLPHPIFVCHGVTDLWIELAGVGRGTKKINQKSPGLQSFPPQAIIWFNVNASLYILFGILYSTALLFWYRYLQTTNSALLEYALDVRFYILSYVISGIIAGVLVVLPFNVS